MPGFIRRIRAANSISWRAAIQIHIESRGPLSLKMTGESWSSSIGPLKLGKCIYVVIVSSHFAG